MLHLNTIACYGDLMLFRRAFFQTEILESLESSIFKWCLEGTWVRLPILPCPECLWVGCPAGCHTTHDSLVLFAHFLFATSLCNISKLRIEAFMRWGSARGHSSQDPGQCAKTTTDCMSQFIYQNSLKESLFQLSQAEHKCEDSKTQSQK